MKIIPRLHITAGISLALGMLICAAAAAAAAPAPASCKGIFSGKASQLEASNMQAGWQLASPDGNLTIRAQAGELVLQNHDGKTAKLGVMAQPDLTEVLWSADSRYLAINTSDGGAVGTWEAKLFAVDAQGQPAAIDLSDITQKISKKTLRCKPQEVANFAALAWVKQDLLLLAEVPPHSSCANMGQILGFRVALTSKKLMKVFSEKSLRANRQELLGCRFSKQ
ncbi:hypothetical protein ACO0LL_25625 [Undibacterium sp. TC4M20W]|uniref:hypothetical protein n=1 Tax=Undibacterium sp. TC4M20W TaxID=3413052 RepID=UPI003BF2310A